MVIHHETDPVILALQNELKIKQSKIEKLMEENGRLIKQIEVLREDELKNVKQHPYCIALALKIEGQLTQIELLIAERAELLNERYSEGQPGNDDPLLKQKDLEIEQLRNEISFLHSAMKKERETDNMDETSAVKRRLCRENALKYRCECLEESHKTLQNQMQAREIMKRGMEYAFKHAICLVKPEGGVDSSESESGADEDEPPTPCSGGDMQLCAEQLTTAVSEVDAVDGDGYPQWQLTEVSQVDGFQQLHPKVAEQLMYEMVPAAKQVMDEVKQALPKQDDRQEVKQSTPKQDAKQEVKQKQAQAPPEQVKVVKEEVKQEPPKQDAKQEITQATPKHDAKQELRAKIAIIVKENFQKDAVAAPKQEVKETPKHVRKETPKQVIKEVPMQEVKETRKQVVKEAPMQEGRKTPKQVAKETPKQEVKDTPKQEVKDTPKQDTKQEVVAAVPVSVAAVPVPVAAVLVPAAAVPVPLAAVPVTMAKEQITYDISECNLRTKFFDAEDIVDIVDVDIENLISQTFIKQVSFDEDDEENELEEEELEEEALQGLTEQVDTVDCPENNVPTTPEEDGDPEFDSSSEDEDQFVEEKKEDVVPFVGEIGSLRKKNFDDEEVVQFVDKEEEMRIFNMISKTYTTFVSFDDDE